MRSRLTYTLMSAILAFSGGPLQADSITRGHGATMSTEVATGVRFHPRSELRRPWEITTDPQLPAQLQATGFSGVFPRMDERRNFSLRAELRLANVEPVSAIRVVFEVYDVWGDRVETLHYDRIADLPPGEHSMTADWDNVSEATARAIYRSQAHISHVRLADGTILRSTTTN